MYVGVFLLIAFPRGAFLVASIVLYLALVATCVQLFIVLYEKPHLRKIFGEQYLEYCRRAPRWIPRLRAAQ
jgi:protein-S-isoprenylcysteine O-methyltransferase Ste14